MPLIKAENGPRHGLSGKSQMNRPTSRAATVATALLLVSLVARGSASQGIPSPLEIQEQALENGFRLLLVEDHSTPRVAANLWYRVGAMQEVNGEHGITHFLEHMIHQGTTTVGTTDFESELPILREINETEQELLAVRDRERNQLRERGVFFDELDWPTTPEMEQLRQRLYELEDSDSQFRKFWAEYTLYRGHGGFSRHTDPVPASTEQEYMEISLALPSQYIELFFRLEADRMINAVLRGWEAQRFTVLEQILNSQSNPQTRFNQAIDGATAMSHPVYQPDGGHLRDFGNFSRQSMLRIYDTYFVPNNATLVLVGDITIDRARALAERYFGAVPQGPEPPASMDLEAEPIPGGTIRLEWSAPLQPQVVVRYRIPGVGHPDRPIFDTIAALLGDRHGMLGSKLMGERQLAISVGVDFRVIHIYRFGSPGAINLVAMGRRDEDLPAIELEMLEVVSQLRQGQIDRAALERAHRALRLEWAQTRSDPVQLAFQIGHFDTMDNFKTLRTHMEGREHVTAEEIQRVAQQYFVPSNRVIATARRDPPPEGGPVWRDLISRNNDER